MLYAPWSNSFGHEPSRTKKASYMRMMLRCFCLVRKGMDSNCAAIAGRPL